MINVVHVPCDCEECTRNQTRLDIFKKLTPFLDRRINELKIKTDLGMANSVDEAEYNQFKEIFPHITGEHNHV